MANKNLSQVIGAGGNVIGDLIFSRASALLDGKVLLDCDGSAFSAVTYPLLGALWPDNVAASALYNIVATDGASLDDNTAGYNVIVPHNIAISDDGNYVVAADYDDDIWALRPATAGEVWTLSSNINRVAISADGNEQIAFSLSYIGGSDFMSVRASTDFGVTWPSSVNVTGTIGATGPAGFLAGMNRAGTTARAFIEDTVAGTWDEWTSGGTLTSGWTNTNSYTFTGPNLGPAGTGTYDYTDDLAGWVLCDSNGLYITTDSGVSWNEEILLDGGALAVSACITSTDDVYAIPSWEQSGAFGGQVLYKTTDGGDNFTEVLNTNEALFAINNPNYEKVRFFEVFSDHNDNLYVLAEYSSGFSNNVAGGKSTLGVLYSTDAGATWGANTLGNVSPPGGTPSTMYDWGSSSATYFSLNRGGTVLFVGQSATANNFGFIDLSTGKYLPSIGGGKIVADAP